MYFENENDADNFNPFGFSASYEPPIEVEMIKGAFTKGDNVIVDFGKRGSIFSKAMKQKWIEGVIDSELTNVMYRVRFPCDKIPGKSTTTMWIHESKIRRSVKGELIVPVIDYKNCPNDQEGDVYMDQNSDGHLHGNW